MGDHAHVLQLHPDVAEQQDLLALLQAPTSLPQPPTQLPEELLVINHRGGILQPAT